MATNLHSRLNEIKEHYTPSHLLTLNNSTSFKLAKLHGDFVWHSHPDTDEIFYCIAGSFVIDINSTAATPEEAEKAGADQVVEFKEGDIYCIKKGVQHRPRAEGEASALLVEKVGTVNTGDSGGGGMTRIVDEGL